MRPLLFLLALVACNNPAADPRAEFLGRWTNTSGSVTATCNGSAMTGMLPAGQIVITISDGTAANALTLSFATPPNCQADAVMSGSTATLSADKVCTVTNGTLTLKQGGTFTTSDGVTLNGAFTSVIADASQSCTQVNTVAFGH